jgi:tetratricopeptide (TPR) repeat protein
MRQVSLLAACLLGVACSPTDEPTVEAVNMPPAYAGAASCSGCHETEFNLWRESHHALAMQHATPQSVVGDFSGVEFQHFETTSTFFTRDGVPHVRTDNEEGASQEYAIKYTFGVTPLQQYLIEFPDGRLQALPVAWDARSVIEGGQRWFHLYPDEPILHDDVLHWTGREQNWNYMCAECHSTNLVKNYNIDSDTYDTTWSEINVSCEACHGPGSNHVAQAEARKFASRYGLVTDQDDTGRAVWEMNVETGIAARSELRMRPPVQPEACGRCHSRRSVLSADYEFGKSLLDTHRPALLDNTLYFADGQIRDEVYVYGSFLQSRMYQAGVSCSDCHEPHSGRLRTGSDPNDVCGTCHLPTRFANTDHHKHQGETVGCVDCHMPSRDYMVIDGRRDHSFRLPRPDLTIATGSPNACNQCHTGEDADWALSAIQNWYGETQRDHYGFAIHAARIGAEDGNELLMEAVNTNSFPGIARGTALSIMRPPYSQQIAGIIQSGFSSADPFVRMGALRALSVLPQDVQVEWGAPLLNDPVRSIRIAAARIISPFRTDIHVQYESAFALAERELIEAMHSIGERPEAQAILGNIYADAGEFDKAEAELRTALRLDPRAVGPRANLADLYRRLSRDPDADVLLREGIELDPDSADLRHSLGLLLVRQGRQEEGLDELRRAVELQEDNARYIYVYAIALNSLGQATTAVDLLMVGKDSFPVDFDIHWALATMLRDQENNAAAREIAEGLATRYPGVPPIQNLLESL